MVVACLLLAAGPATAADPLPRYLDCTVSQLASWVAGDFAAHPVGTEDDPADSLHLDTSSGAWFLTNPRSAALTIGGGDFEILQNGTDYRTHWIGTDNAGRTQLRIARLDTRHAFILLDRDGSIHTGDCHEPDEIFLFLR